MDNPMDNLFHVSGCIWNLSPYGGKTVIYVRNRYVNEKWETSITCNPLNLLARLKGFEPLTYGLEVRCSIQLSYRRAVFGKCMRDFYA